MQSVDFAHWVSRIYAQCLSDLFLRPLSFRVPPAHSRFFTIHPLDIFLQGLFIFAPLITLMAPISGEEMWQGTPEVPHSTDNIYAMKSCLVDGYSVVFRRGNTTIEVRQGPEGRKRTAPFGVVLSVISDAKETGDLAKRIGRSKYIYLVKSGGDHATYASFEQYKLPKPEACPTTQSIPGTTPSSFIISSSELTTRTLRALSYGGGALAAQSFWWVSRNAVWMRYPILVPDVIATIVFSGVTPSVIADWVMGKLTTAGGHLAHVCTEVSKTWLGDPWLRITLVCCGLIFWWWCKPVRNRQGPESEDSPRKPQEKVGNKIAIPEPPREGKRAGDIRETPQDRVADLRSTPENRVVDPGNDTMCPAQSTGLQKPGLASCQDALIQHRDKSGHAFCPTPCRDVASFMVPLAAHDSMRCIPITPNVSVISDGRTVLLRARNWDSYQQGPKDRPCHVQGCLNAGFPFPVHEGIVLECVEQTKLRILHTKTNDPPQIKERKWKKLADDGSPEMPPLETYTGEDPPDFNLSGQRLTASTASNQDDFTHRIKDLGGRPTPVSHSANKVITGTQPAEGATDLRDLKSAGGKEMIIRKASRSRKSTSLSSQSDSLVSAFSSRSASTSKQTGSGSSSPSRARRKDKRKSHKRRHRPSSSRSSSDSAQSLMPKGLSHAKYHRPRKTVREMSAELTREKPSGKYDAIVGRLGAMADKEDRKAGGMTKLDQFTVCALRGFGFQKVELCTGKYGVELESSLRRVARTDRDHLWRKHLKIPITNRIARAASTGRFGNIAGDGTDDISVTMSD